MVYFCVLCMLLLLSGHQCETLEKSFDEYSSGEVLKFLYDDKTDYQSLSCMDNWNNPVDWWYLYKPASDEGAFVETGTNFSYVLPETAGRWLLSMTDINTDSMLQNTLAPLYDPKYRRTIATLVYGQADTPSNSGSSAYGVMMANELGGVWVVHTIPDFPDLNGIEATLPEVETGRGHLIMCLSQDNKRMDRLATLVEHVQANILKLNVPNHLRQYLPKWTFLMHSQKTQYRHKYNTKVDTFITSDQSLSGLIIARRPGDQRCVYKAFARAKQVVMDVYGHHEHREVICNPKFSLRRINSISLKFADQVVYYMKNDTDAMSFAVTTGAPWQRGADGDVKYWACIGSVGNEPAPGKSGIVVCANNYDVWLTFDNLKVKEPDCKE